MHWPDPAQRNRIAEIRDNLTARIAEADREGWPGEAEGLKTESAITYSRFRTTVTGCDFCFRDYPARPAGARQPVMVAAKAGSRPCRDVASAA
jgi:hypothetical protein